MSRRQVGRGKCFPIGATVHPQGVNFCLYSKHATLVELLLFDHEDDAKPSEVIPLDPRQHRTYHYWRVFVPDLKPGQLYGYRVTGPQAPERGLRFDPDKVLLDPYGLAVAVPKSYSREAAGRPGNNAASAMKSVVVDPCRCDWEHDVPLKIPFVKTVIYELHVKGFTRHPSSGVEPDKRGTYAGLIEKIPYLQDLGVTAVELLPVFQFDPHDAPPGRVNYWGYAPISFFAPHRAYSSRQDALGPLDEFRDMVKALHRAGIEVILDVVFNHTAEGNHEGPTLCYRGLANDAYYILEPDRAYYSNYTGCGNTLNANHPVVRRMIVDSLRYWVTHMHVDGFRFDLASILSRDETGRPLPNAPILWDIESDPMLAGAKLIAEAWDPGGLYQVGSFIGDSWNEWNGRFRDDVRGFLKGDPGTVSRVASRLLGSPDLYGHEEREPEQSINFVTCHDGFTLNDLVSYNGKHNDTNGEGNRDGSNDNLSWNCGVEGPTDDPAVEALRNRQIKNFLALTLLAIGTPMVLMGDEMRQTQRGNNNAYCQDNEVSWLDWRLLDKHADVHRFLKYLSAFRKQRDVAVKDSGLSLNQLMALGRVQWHGVRLNRPDWSADSHTLAFTVNSVHGRFRLHMMINAYWEPLTFAVPPVEAPRQGPWQKLMDTALAMPDDIHEFLKGPVHEAASYTVQARAMAALVAPLITTG
jgi:glycogen operon protein